MSAIRFYLDENIDRRVAVALRRAGVDVETVNDANMLGFSDRSHLGYASTSKCVLVTHDSDFLDIGERIKPHTGIIFARRVGFTAQALAQALIDIHATQTAEERLNSILVISAKFPQGQPRMD